MKIQLIAGLGNPGAEYVRTRHNVGFWLLDALQVTVNSAQFRVETKFHGEISRAQINGSVCWLLKPTTFMNRSGQSIVALSNFYQIPPESILLVHDDLDLPPGAVRLKQGGGHGGHNGLRDTITQLGSANFYRLRVGIGHPGHRDLVTGYVLGIPSQEDRKLIEVAIEQTLAELPAICQGNLVQVMNRLHQN